MLIRLFRCDGGGDSEAEGGGGEGGCEGSGDLSTAGR